MGLGSCRWCGGIHTVGKGIGGVGLGFHLMEKQGREGRSWWVQALGEKKKGGGFPFCFFCFLFFFPTHFYPL